MKSPVLQRLSPSQPFRDQHSQHKQVLAAAMSRWTVPRGPSIHVQPRNAPIKRAIAQTVLKKYNTFEQIPALPEDFVADWLGSGVENPFSWSELIKSPTDGKGLSMDGDFDAWHAHMCAIWQRQADAREERRLAANRTARQRQEYSAKEKAVLKCESARCARVLRKLQKIIKESKLNERGNDWRNAAATVGQRLAGTLPTTWTISMIRDESTSSLRVLYRPPPSARPSSSNSQAPAAPLESVTSVQKYLSDMEMPNDDRGRPVSGRSFLHIERMLQEEVAKKSKHDRVSVTRQPAAKLDEEVIDQVRGALEILKQRKVKFGKYLKEAEDRHALLLRKNAQLKQGMRGSKVC